jgi:hypothetical protein
MSSGLDVVPCSVLALGVGLSVMLVAIIILRDRGKSIDNPACGKCGYPAQGLPTFICPECGSDLRETGIVTPGGSGLSPTIRGAILVLFWTLVLPVPAAMLTLVVIEVAPQTTETHARQRFHSPDSGVYQRIDLDQRVTEKGNRVASNRLTCTLVPSQGTPIQIEIDPVRLGYRYQQQSGKEAKAATGLNESTFLDWMSQAGIDRENTQVRLEAAELMTFAQGAVGNTVDELTAQHFRQEGESRYSRVGPAKWVLATTGAFWLAVWLLGCWRLWRIGTQKRR